MRDDIRDFSGKELSLLVRNTEELFDYRKDIPLLIAILRERYLYTPEQEAFMLEDLQALDAEIERYKQKEIAKWEKLHGRIYNGEVIGLDP